MPIHKSAVKKAKQDKERTARNLSLKRKVKGLIREYKLKPSAEGLRKVQSTLSLTSKRHVFHKNKARRLLSRLVKGLPKMAEKKIASKSRKKTT